MFQELSVVVVGGLLVPLESTLESSLPGGICRMFDAEVQVTKCHKHDGSIISYVGGFSSAGSLESDSQNEWTGTSRKRASSLVWKDLRKHSLT